MFIIIMTFLSVELIYFQRSILVLKDLTIKDLKKIA